jgi:hypothetical protein
MVLSLLTAEHAEIAEKILGVLVSAVSAVQPILTRFALTVRLKPDTT